MTDGLSLKLRELGFNRAGNFERYGDRVRIVLAAAKKDHSFGHVYVWIGLDADRKPSEVLYVGKAGFTLAARMAQHMGGFQGSKKGRQHRDNCILRLDAGIELWSRSAEKIKLFGHEVSLCEAEERALIKVLKPEWNKQKR